MSTVLVDCLGLRPGEDLLVVTDPGKRPLGDAVAAGALALGAEAVVVEMAERETHGAAPPRPVAAAMLGCDVVIAPTTKSISHTEARRAATAAGVRVATMPDVTEDMLIRTMGADYMDVRALSRALAEILSQGDEAHVVTEAGTDLRLSLTGRVGISDDGDLRASGAFGNLPAGEAFIAPVEGRASGTLVIDGTIWPLGLLRDPLIMTVEDGYAVDVSGPGAERLRAALEPYGRDAFAVAEFGIGTNASARLSGTVLEDEKVLGTVHVAFGDNHTFGGTVRVPSHQDGIVLRPTVTVDGTTVLEGGRLAIMP